MTTTTNTINLALDVANEEIAKLQAKLAAALADAAVAASPADVAEEVTIFFADNVSAPQATQAGRATVYETATRAAAGEITVELYEGARGIPQTFRHADTGGTLHMDVLQAAFYGADPRFVGDEMTKLWLAANVNTARGFRKYKGPDSANGCMVRLANARMVARQGNGVGTRGTGYTITDAFFTGAATALVWEDGAIVRRRLYVAR